MVVENRIAIPMKKGVTCFRQSVDPNNLCNPTTPQYHIFGRDFTLLNFNNSGNVSAMRDHAINPRCDYWISDAYLQFYSYETIQL